ncbi:MFS transporter [Aeromicrobium phragmitis]|uniref:MFS transporter n=1 Tax=Aeromicrobium phragmitis TaxID=2478914 RepID=A0A3L8PHU1_9ACTN|nr:MFS transporter [Aeromicrobium phragmitis]RLV54856.1 MFS transporter [Aeromicrobium phragmitis]
MSSIASNLGTEPLEPDPPGAPDRESAEFRAKGRRALGAAVFGFFVDMYDVYLPVIVLAPAMAYFMPPETSTADTAIFFSLIFVASIIGRPLGSLLFGPLGDRVGRRRITLIAAAGSAICTGAMVVLPGYSTLGVGALAILVVLRLLDGIFLGGEYTGANPLAMEYTPAHRRGVAGSLINTGFPLALAFITLVTLATMSVLPTGDADSAYAVWGWRIPFLLGFLLCSALFLYYLFSVPESEIWTKASKPAGNPLRELFSRRHLRVMAVSFVAVTGAWLTMNSTVGVFANHFRGLGVGDGNINATILVVALVGASLFPVMGALGQRFGRRQVIMGIGLTSAVVGSSAFALAVSNRDNGALLFALGILVILPGLMIWALITAFLMELFPTEIRASGYGVAYALPSIIPACYAYYMAWLGNVMDYAYTPVVLIVLGGALIALGGYLAADRRHVDLEDIE